MAHPPPLEPYKHWNRTAYYSSEQIEISKDEMNEIRKQKPEPVEAKPMPKPGKPVKCIIDTDIGTDFDDTMALLYALHISDLEILGITTNYGIPRIRAGVARKVVDAYHCCHPEKPQFPIVSGASCQLGTHRHVFLAGNEGKPFYKGPEYDSEFICDNWSKHCQTDGADFIVSTVKQFPNEVTIISIGIPTNIAIAFKRCPAIIPLVKEIIIMGCGSFIREGKTKQANFPFLKTDMDPVDWLKEGKIIQVFPNHNVSGDTMASKVLFSSGVKMKIIPHDVTCHFWVEGEAIDFLRNRAKEVKDLEHITDPAAVTGLLMLEWFERRDGQNGQCPHDPLTIHEAVYGEDDSPLLYVPGTMILHEWAAFGTFIPHKDGKHFLAVQTRNEEKFLSTLSASLLIDDTKQTDLNAT